MSQTVSFHLFTHRPRRAKKMVASYGVRRVLPAAQAGRPGRDPNSVSSTGLAFLSSQFFTYFVEVFVLDRVWILV